MYDSSFERFGFYYDPRNDDYKVLKFSLVRDRVIRVFLYSLRLLRWRYILFDGPNNIQRLSDFPPSLSSNRIHCVAKCNHGSMWRVVSFGIND